MRRLLFCRGELIAGILVADYTGQIAGKQARFGDRDMAKGWLTQAGCGGVLLGLALVGTADNPKPGLSNGAPLSPHEEQATFRVVKGFRAELVACEPQVVDPVAMAFDEEGRLFVAEMRGYPNAGVATGSIHSGKVKLLEDRDGDGFYEHATVFAEGLRFPTSVFPWRGGLIVAVAPDLVYFEDTDGDGKADRHRTLYTGFGLDNIQQLVNSLTYGLDNWVYACAGSNGGTVRSAEKPDMPAVTLRNRGVRFQPDRPGSLQPTSGGGQFGLAADAWGQWFTATNSHHLRHLILPDHYLRRNPALAVSAVLLDVPDHGAVCKVHRISPFEAWRVERTQRRAGGPDARKFVATELVPGGYITSATSPVVYTADLFPAPFRGNTFVCDPANNIIHRDRLEPKGATFVARIADEGCEFLASTDNWFRPVNLSVGPDGALYVLDFYREVIETPLSLPDDIKARLNLESRGRGRIWRIVPESGAPRKKPSLRKAPTEELVRHLNDPNAWWRGTAQRLLMERQDRAAIPYLAKLAQESPSAVGRVHALWTLRGLHALEDSLIEQALKDPVAEVREQGLRLAEEPLRNSSALRGQVVSLAKDPSPRVRFQLAFTLGEVETPEAATALTAIVRQDADDPWTQSAVLSSARRTAGSLLDSLLKEPGFTAKAPAARVQFLQRLAMLVGVSGTEAEQAAALAALAKDGDDAAGWKIAVLEGLGQGLQTGRLPLSRLMESPSARLREAVEQTRPFFAKAAALAQDESRPVAGRLAAIRLLGYGPFSTGGPTLQALLAPRSPAEIQLAAVRALAQQDHREIAGLLLAPWAGLSPPVRREVLEALFARSERLPELLAAIEKNQVLASQLDPFRLEQLRKHPLVGKNKALQARLSGSAASDRQKIVEQYLPVLQLPADASRGKAVFKKTCATCHRLEDVGIEVGPDLLSALRNKTGERLVLDILDPSREVDPRYINYIVTTTAGRVITGMIRAETATSITLRRAEGAEDVILRSQIEEIQGTAKSLMPENLETQFGKQDLADVIAYLLSVAAK
jgi:putative membrane-bound dehydrogenase-like protein